MRLYYMVCYFPMQGWRSRIVSDNGKRSVVFNPNKGYLDMPCTVPCSQCIGCRLERSRQWAIRCMHEASLHEDNCFITLTYSPEFLPSDNSLVKSDFQKFFKKFRSYLLREFKKLPLYHDAPRDMRSFIVDKYFKSPRYYMCGEYGERFGRPHYHACIFGYDFPDKVLIRNDKSSSSLFDSPLLSKIWGKGRVSVGAVTFESAAYVARYIMKKVTGDASKDHYWNVDYDTGEAVPFLPEYTTMSRNPGIAYSWFQKYGSDVFPKDEVIVRRLSCRPPKYYDSLYELTNPDDFVDIKRKRLRLSKLNAANSTRERLDVRREVKESRLSALVRSYDMEN